MNAPSSGAALPLWTARTAGLLASNTLAGFGAWIDFLVILAMAAYTYGANGFVMALVSALFLVPGLLLGPKVGRWLDRNDPGSALVAALVARAAATALLLLQPPLALFCAVVALRSVFTVPVEPAFNVLASRLVAKDAVPQYFGVLGLARNVAKIFAPAAGTAIASRYGDGAALGLSIALGVLALAVGLPTWFALARDGGAPARAADAAAAVSVPPAQAAARHDALRVRFLALVTVFAFVVFFVNHQLPVLLRDAGFDKAVLGALVSCSGAGGILAGVYMSRTNAAVLAQDPLTATTLAIAATAACFVVLGVAFLLPPAVAPYAAGAVFFATGVFASIEAIRSNTVIVQQFGAQAGEVSGKVQAYTSAAMLGSPWVAALVMPLLSLPSLLVLDGALGLTAVAIVVMRLRRAPVLDVSR